MIFKDEGQFEEIKETNLKSFKFVKRSNKVHDSATAFSSLNYDRKKYGTKVTKGQDLLIETDAHRFMRKNNADNLNTMKATILDDLV